MRRTPAESAALWCTRVRRAMLVGVLAAFTAAVAGCGLTSPRAFTPATVTPSTPSLVFVVDGNFVTTTCVCGLRPSVVALDARDGHRVWLHALEASNPADEISATSSPLSRDGLVYVSYYYDRSDSGDPQNRVRHGVMAALDATTGQERWHREIGSMLAREPVVDGSTVYVSATVVQMPTQGQPPPAVTGLLEALDARTGDVRWSRVLPTTPSMAAAADGRVFVITSRQFAGDVLALDAGDGSVRWDYASDAPLTRGGDAPNTGSDAPQVVAGRVFVEATERDAGGDAQLNLLALDSGNGHVDWQYQTSGIAATPAFNQSGDTVCLGVSNPMANTSDILGLATSNGAPRWSVTGIAGLVSGCAVSGDTFYLTQRSADGTTGSVIALTGQGASSRSIWKTATAAPVAADGLLAPSVSGNLVGVYLAVPTPTGGPVLTTMAVLRASDGQLLWQHAYNGRPDYLLDIEGNLIVTSEYSGDLPIVAAYALETGTRLWTYALGHL